MGEPSSLSCDTTDQELLCGAELPPSTGSGAPPKALPLDIIPDVLAVLLVPHGMLLGGLWMCLLKLYIYSYIFEEM